MDIAAEVDALFGDGAAAGIDLEALETVVRRRTLDLAARLVERRLKRDHGDCPGSWLPCDGCGGRAAYAGRRGKEVTTVLGALHLERAYYHCAHCGTGFHPRDRALGIEGASLSPGVVRMTGLAAARASFAETGALLHDLAGVNVDAKQAERTAEALGREIAADERDVVEPSRAGRDDVLGMDVPASGGPGGLAGRAASGRGSARTREVSWSRSGGAADAGPRICRAQRAGQYSALETAATRDDDVDRRRPRRVDREARRRGFDGARRRVVLGDGAPWI